VWGRSREGRRPEVEATTETEAEAEAETEVWGGRSKERRHCEGDRGREGVTRERELVGFDGNGEFGSSSPSVFLFLISFLFLFF
jgi:hypothetical protein